MKGKLEEHLKQLKLDKETTEETINLIKVAREEFPCMSCPSKDECASFKWFIKWFGEI